MLIDKLINLVILSEFTSQTQKTGIDSDQRITIQRCSHRLGLK